MRDYEVMTIHNPELAEADVQAKVEGLGAFLEERGAEVKAKDLWGKRRFAYEIDHLSEGYYSIVTFAADGEVIDSLDRMLSLADEVVRHKVVRPGA
jgi:small subunit ribosomal protein S6